MKVEREATHTTRQWKLHQLLKDNQHRYLKHIDILLYLQDEYFDKSVETFDLLQLDLYYAHERTLLSKDISAIKDSLIIKRVLISCNKGIKYATEAEAIEYFKRQQEAIERKFIKLNMQRNKLGLNGQYVLRFSGNEKHMIESVMK